MRMGVARCALDGRDGMAGMESGVKSRCCLDERGAAGMASRGVPTIGSVCQVKSRIGVAKALDILPNM